ncbi:MAG: hypothetical protein ACJAQ3_001238 [Planctomycetota bacterium]
MGLYCALGWALVWRLHRRSVAASLEVSGAVNDLARCRVDSRVVPSLCTAFCYGFFSPRLALPSSLISGQAASCLESVLHHEASHLRRRDSVRRVLVTAAAPMLFWNPLYWWMAHEAALSAEFVADGSATRALGRKRYARELLLLATPIAHHRPALGLGGSHFLRRKGELRRRILMLHHSTALETAPLTRIGRLGRTAIASVSLAALTIGLGRSAEQERTDVPSAGSQVAERASATYDLDFEAPDAKTLGAMVSYLSQGSLASGGWLGVRTVDQASASDGMQSVRIRGVDMVSLAELQSFAREVGALLVKVVRASPQPAAKASPALESAEELARTVKAINETIQRLNSEGQGTIGRLVQDDATSQQVAAAVAGLRAAMHTSNLGQEKASAAAARDAKVSGPTFPSPGARLWTSAFTLSATALSRRRAEFYASWQRLALPRWVSRARVQPRG